MNILTRRLTSHSTRPAERGDLAGIAEQVVRESAEGSSDEAAFHVGSCAAEFCSVVSNQLGGWALAEGLSHESRATESAGGARGRQFCEASRTKLYTA